MGAVKVLFVLPVIILLITPRIQAQPLSDDQLLANENDCIEMTDERADEIRVLVKELTDFIDALAEKHEDLDLRLVKLDVDRHTESEPEEKSTVLEIFVNDCGKRFDSDRFTQNSDDKEYENDIEQSVNKDDEAESLTETASADVTVAENNSDVNQHQNSKTSKNKKRNKAKNEGTANKRRSKKSNKTRAINTDKDVNRRDKSSTTKISLKRKKAGRSVESFSNYNEKASVDDVNLEDSNDSYISSNDNFQSSKDIEENEDGKLYTDDSCSEETTSSVNKRNKPTNKSKNDDIAGNYDSSFETESTDESHEGNKRESLFKNKPQLTTNYDNNDAEDSSVENEENTEKSSVKNVKTKAENTKTYYTDKESTEETTSTKNKLTKKNKNDDTKTTINASKINRETSIKTKKQQAKNANNDNDKITTDMEYESDYYNTNEKKTKINIESYESEQKSFTDSQLIQSLRQMIRNEFKTLTNDHQNGANSESSTQNDEKSNKTGYVGKEGTAKPEFILLDLENDVLQLIKRQKCKSDNPLLVYLQERGEQRIVIL